MQGFNGGMDGSMQMCNGQQMPPFPFSSPSTPSNFTPGNCTPGGSWCNFQGSPDCDGNGMQSMFGAQAPQLPAWPQEQNFMSFSQCHMGMMGQTMPGTMQGSMAGPMQGVMPGNMIAVQQP